jgi:hypothetical protein
MPKMPILNGSVVTFDGKVNYDISGVHSIDDTPDFITKVSDSEYDIELNASTIPYDESGVSIQAKLDEMSMKPTEESIAEQLEDYAKTVSVNSGDPVVPDEEGIVPLTATYPVSQADLAKLLIISRASQKIIVNGNDLIPADGVVDLGDIDAGSYIKPGDGIPESDLSENNQNILDTVKDNNFVSGVKVSDDTTLTITSANDIDLTTILSALYIKQNNGVPLSDFSEDAKVAINSANIAARRILICGSYYLPDENGLVDLGDADTVAFPGVMSLTGNLVNNDDVENPVATATFTLGGQRINIKPNVFEILSDDILDYSVDDEPIKDILSGYEAGGIQKIIINLKEYNAADGEIDIPSIKKDVTGVLSLEGNVVDVKDPNSSAINVYIKIGNEIITPHGGVFTITTSDILNSITPNFEYYFDNIEKDLVKGIILDGETYNPDDDGVITINTTGDKYIPPADGIANPDIATAVLTALSQRTTNTLKGIKIGNNIHKPEFGVIRLLKAVQLDSDGFQISDMSSDVIDTLNNANNTVKSLKYGSTRYATDSAGTIDISAITGYTMPPNGIPLSDLPTDVVTALNKPANSVKKIQVGDDVENVYEPNQNGIIDIGRLEAFVPPPTGIPMSMLAPDLQIPIRSLSTIIQTIIMNDTPYTPDENANVTLPMDHKWTADEASVTLSDRRVLSLKQTTVLPTNERTYDAITASNIKYNDDDTVKDAMDKCLTGVINIFIASFITTITYTNTHSVTFAYPNPFVTTSGIDISINDTTLYSNVASMTLGSPGVMMDSTQNRATTFDSSETSGTITLRGIWYPGINGMTDISSLVQIYSYPDRPTNPTVPVSIIGVDPTSSDYVAEPTITIALSWYTPDATGE